MTGDALRVTGHVPRQTTLSPQSSLLSPDMRIGLLGGTFNPIHNCHLFIAGQTRDRLNLERVLFIPSSDPPHKPSTSLAPASHRRVMVELAIESEPRFALSEVELKRPNKSYSIETVQALRTEFGPSAELFFILGLDSFVEFPTWKQASALLKLCHFVVVSRPGTSFASLTTLSLLPPLDPSALEALDQGTEERADISLPGGTMLILLHLPPCYASASDIRHRVKTGQTLATLLPPQIESYIIRSGLYREDANRTRL